MLRHIAKGTAPLTQALQALAHRKSATEQSEGPRVVRGDIDSLPAVYLAAAVLDPLYIFDGAGSVLYSNEAADLAFGPMTKSVSLRLKFRAPEMHELVSRVISGVEESTAINYSERVPVERAYRVVASRIGNDTGLYVLMFKDQSEARRIDRMRADFIANASHELRTPLASVAGFIETLRGPARDDAKARENFLQIMQNQTQRMARLIDDLLSLSRLEMKPYQKPNAQLDVVALVKGVIEPMRHIARENGVEIVSELGDAPLLVAGHSDELVQVFENLLENACKYGSSGERILVSADQASPMDEVRVRVQDFGPGIPEEHIPRITERFYRVDVETSRTQKGTGLGLSIVKHILTRHDARLSVKSAPGEGATFVVHFPPVPPSGTGAESA
ncbi:two-component system, OmpR family, phosphate regulon sensor histidine kinase PhoR [Nitratireductor aquibiodomus]|uniref:histidine kinase n=1 Tax=Nitratireductor aquibiodomus TaxID=204799 RepID=A0A1H4LMB1_9HYPH|nr:ATP-binding protein [Nitratireductor aquibiodomus]SEB71728.1 two-component system, OmpR family, phosphate regulon sensor histidine kinase PhoR [Nitratireductor aquibiodomus]